MIRPAERGPRISSAPTWRTKRSRGRGRVLKRIQDPEATALVLLDALTFYRLQREREAAAPYGVDSERFIRAWCDPVPQLAA